MKASAWLAGAVLAVAACLTLASRRTEAPPLAVGSPPPARFLVGTEVAGVKVEVRVNKQNPFSIL